MIKMYTLGGINEVGRNMSAYEFDDNIVICDMGTNITALVEHNDEVQYMQREELIEKNVIADPKNILDKKDKVRAIFISHAHLDHVGGALYLADLFPNAPIYGSYFTIEVLKVLQRSNSNKNFPKLANRLVKLPSNAEFDIGNGIKVEFVNMTHSTPQMSGVAIHTPNDGIIFYAMDFKFDNRPGLGYMTNYPKLKELNEKGITLAVVDALRSNQKKKTLSEITVKEMLRDIFIETSIMETQGIVVTTFASHIARLKTIFELNRELKRKVVFLGRSMAKYCEAAKFSRVYDFKEKEVIICETPKDVNKWMEIVNKNKKDYLVVCTGHQGEPNAVLSKIAEERTPFKLNQDDIVVFSSEVIPTTVNIDQSKILQSKLEATKCKIYRDIHVSGHSSKDDLKEFMNMVKPKYLVPGHAPAELKQGLVDIAKELGYEEGKNLMLVQDQKVYEFK